MGGGSWLDARCQLHRRPHYVVDTGQVEELPPGGVTEAGQPQLALGQHRLTRLEHHLLTVALMEDSSPAQKAVSEVFVTELGWSLRILSNSREVEDTVKSFPNYFYILDNKIGNKENEGLTALDLIHGVSPKVYCGYVVGIFK